MGQWNGAGGYLSTRRQRVPGNTLHLSTVSFSSACFEERGLVDQAAASWSRGGRRFLREGPHNQRRLIGPRPTLFRAAESVAALSSSPSVRGLLRSTLLCAVQRREPPPCGASRVCVCYLVSCMRPDWLMAVAGSSTALFYMTNFLSPSSSLLQSHAASCRESGATLPLLPSVPQKQDRNTNESERAKETEGQENKQKERQKTQNIAPQKRKRQKKMHDL